MHFMRYLCAVALVSMLCPASMHCTLEPQPDKAGSEKKIDQQATLAAVVKTAANTAGSIVEASHSAGEVVKANNTHQESVSLQPRTKLRIVIPSGEAEKTLPHPPDSPPGSPDSPDNPDD